MDTKLMICENPNSSIRAAKNDSIVFLPKIYDFTKYSKCGEKMLKLDDITPSELYMHNGKLTYRTMSKTIITDLNKIRRILAAKFNEDYIGINKTFLKICSETDGRNRINFLANTFSELFYQE